MNCEIAVVIICCWIEKRKKKSMQKSKLYVITVIQGDQKAGQLIPKTCSVCGKINYIEIRRQTVL
jgi:hypothetical protein